MAKQFDLLLKTSKCEEWWKILQDFRANNWQELLSLYRKIKQFKNKYDEQQRLKI